VSTGLGTSEKRLKIKRLGGGNNQLAAVGLRSGLPLEMSFLHDWSVYRRRQSWLSLSLAGTGLTREKGGGALLHAWLGIRKVAA
jgi:hypothetical protein